MHIKIIGGKKIADKFARTLHRSSSIGSGSTEGSISSTTPHHEAGSVASSFRNKKDEESDIVSARSSSLADFGNMSMYSGNSSLGPDTSGTELKKSASKSSNLSQKMDSIFKKGGGKLQRRGAVRAAKVGHDGRRAVPPV